MSRGDHQEPSRNRARLAGVALALAAAGIGVAVLGQRLSSPAPENWVGPALTLAGAAVWLFGRRRDRS